MSTPPNNQPSGAVTSQEATRKNPSQGKFKSGFQKAEIQQYIQNSEKSITGSDIKVILQKRIPITLNQTNPSFLVFV